MCIVAILLDENSRFPLMIVENRDEDVNRPSVDVDVVDDELICGLDKLKNGTWCGYNVKKGHFSFLTNYHNRKAYINNCYHVDDGELLSRGKIVRDSLIDSKEMEQHIGNDFEKYPGFNLLYGTIHHNQKSSSKLPIDLNYLCNKSMDQNAKNHLTMKKLYPKKENIESQSSTKSNCFCMSNSWLDDESWDKVHYLKNKMHEVNRKYAVQNEKVDIEGNGVTIFDVHKDLARILSARLISTYENIPTLWKMEIEQSKNTVLKNELISGHQSIFIESDDKLYKTISQSIMIMDRDANVHYFYRNTKDLKMIDHFDPIISKSTDTDTVNQRIFTQKGWTHYSIKNQKILKCDKNIYNV